jgi:alpha-methylacyl-CoA racemase
VAGDGRVTGWRAVAADGGPLSGVRVLDFSTLLPGPLATLLLAEAGADVLKVERPGVGDEMRTYTPRLGHSSANFALLNRGKRSVVLDLKDPRDVERARELAAEADVVVEQFRPGVMNRLGLGHPQLAAANPGLVYCSITGYGQKGAEAQLAGHDLNYMAQAGLLDLVRDGRGDPALPPALIADIAGGSYPAVFNIMMALYARQASGRGAHLDLAMTDNLATLGYWVQAQHAGSGTWPKAGDELLTGASPRYQLYRTSDDRHLAAAPLEERFWRRFCELVGLPPEQRDDSADPAGTIAAVDELIRARTAAEWEAIFRGEDVCCALVSTPEEAYRARPPSARHRVAGEGYDVPALPVPLAATLRPERSSAKYPPLDEPPPRA